ncbi:serine protease easter-like [Thrips palmi]|uniref:CLIP domain-containing serine protease n=1 Tax=Thrips palmi TaxID=161013 RepID=A0A6P8ZZT7_THRPL|nr:serine protease easter-like [Thrips palmi]
MPVPNLPDCTTPLSQAGNCVRLHNCKPLLDLLKTSRLGPRGLPDSEVTLLLRRSHCGFQGNSVMVCCPVDASAFRGKPSSTAAPALSITYAPQSRPRPPAAPGAFGGSGSQQRPAAPTGGDAGFEFSTPAPEAYPAPGSGPPTDSNNEGAGFAGAASYPALSSSYPAASSSYPAAPEAAPAPAASNQQEGQDSFPLENLGLLPVEICGLMLHPGGSNPANNRTGLMQYPWMARLGYKQGDGDAVEFLCTGSLISERYVVTAAHCVEARDGLVTVRLGESDAATDPDCVESSCAPGVVDVAVEDKVVHEDYRRGVNDIALLRLARPVAFSEAVSPICLPVQSHNRPEEDLVGRHMSLAGWGNSSPYRRQHAPSRWLLQHRMHVVAQSACRAAYDALDDVHFQSDKHLCVGGGCYGDSGSPLMLAEGGAGGGEMMDNRAVLYGVLSYGLPDCALRSSPLAFTKVSHHVPWLVRNLRPNPFVPKDRSSGSGVVDPRRTRHPAPGAGYLHQH